MRHVGWLSFECSKNDFGDTVIWMRVKFRMPDLCRHGIRKSQFVLLILNELGVDLNSMSQNSILEGLSPLLELSRRHIYLVVETDHQLWSRMTNFGYHEPFVLVESWSNGQNLAESFNIELFAIAFHERVDDVTEHDPVMAITSAFQEIELWIEALNSFGQCSIFDRNNEFALDRE